SGYGNPVGELSNQMGNSIASKCDMDCMNELYNAKTIYTSTKIMSYETVVDGIDVFDEEENSEKVIFVHPKQVTQLRKDANFISKEKYNNEVIATGEIGMIGNARVVTSKKVMLTEYDKVASADGATQITASNIATYQGKVFPKIAVGDYVKAATTKYYVNPLVKLVTTETDDESPALTIFVKRDTNIETERKSKTRTTEITGDKMYVVALTNDSKVVNVKSLQVATV
ncbi:MAG: N4-gp56 family major capsid protein, partial [Erysipelotrichia bacterium]|nr:N4-gp56 family major capsid protein [Erysipelotrichia bacterium]